MAPGELGRLFTETRELNRLAKLGVIYLCYLVLFL